MVCCLTVHLRRHGRVGFHVATGSRSDPSGPGMWHGRRAADADCRGHVGIADAPRHLGSTCSRP
jgi:hypothetical protein